MLYERTYFKDLSQGNDEIKIYGNFISNCGICETISDTAISMDNKSILTN